MRKVAIVATLVLLMLPATAAAQEEDSYKRWSISLRLGSFSTSKDLPWVSYTERVRIGIEFTRYISNRSAMSLTLDAATDADEYFAFIPMTVTYKVFPWGNGFSRSDRNTNPPMQPWFGGGIGVYIHEPSWYSNGVVGIGAHAAGGAVIPMCSFFELNAELRYAVTNDFRMLTYMAGFGFRF